MRHVLPILLFVLLITTLGAGEPPYTNLHPDIIHKKTILVARFWVTQVIRDGKIYDEWKATNPHANFPSYITSVTEGAGRIRYEMKPGDRILSFETETDLTPK